MAAQVVQLRGHLGPAVVAGARMGMAGLRAVEAEGYFDVELACEGPFAKPPQSCFLDGHCWLDDELFLDVNDSTFREAGRVGLWTKADAVTYFDDLSVQEASW